MNILELEQLEQHAWQHSCQLLNQWLKGVTFDTYLPREEVEEHVLNRLPAIVLDFLSTDTATDYHVWANTLYTLKPEASVDRRMGWGPEEFFKDIQRNLQDHTDLMNNRVPIAPNMNTDEEKPLHDFVDACFSVINTKWLSGIKFDAFFPRNTLEQVLVQRFEKPLQALFFLDTPLSIVDILRAFTNEMKPGAHITRRHNWSVDEFVNDIAAQITSFSQSCAQATAPNQISVSNILSQRHNQHAFQRPMLGAKIRTTPSDYH